MHPNIWTTAHHDSTFPPVRKQFVREVEAALRLVDQDPSRILQAIMYDEGQGPPPKGRGRGRGRVGRRARGRGRVPVPSVDVAPPFVAAVASDALNPIIAGAGPSSYVDAGAVPVGSADYGGVPP